MSFPYNESDAAFLAALAEELQKHGDVRRVWQLEVKERRYGIDESFRDADGWTLFDGDGEELATVFISPKDVPPSLAAKGWEWRAFTQEWRVEPGRVALTEKGLQAHLDANGHNYREADGVKMRCEHLYRCPDLARLIDLAKKGLQSA